MSRSPRRSPNKFSPRVYAIDPVVDQILLEHLGIEELIARHKVNPELYESQSSLNSLSRRFNLARATTFRAFLRNYDQQYATVRSYFLPGAKPKEILLQAAEAGNLQAFYTGLKLYPEYKVPAFLNQSLQLAARGDHQVMIDLIKDLGATDLIRELTGTVEGGHLARLKRLDKPNRQEIYKLSMIAAGHGYLATLKYLVSLDEIDQDHLDALIYNAGQSGNQGVVDYLVSLGGDNYTKLITGALSRGHFDLAVKYLDQPDLNYIPIFNAAVTAHNLDLAKLIAKGRNISPRLLNAMLGFPRTEEEIEYLISLGANNYFTLLLELVRQDNLDLFIKYYKRGRGNYVELFLSGILRSSIKIVKFMIQHRLVPVETQDLNGYLVKANTIPMLDLLFSFGATYYTRVVTDAIFDGKFDIADKYFDQADVDINELYLSARGSETRKYLLTKPGISQATIDYAVDSRRTRWWW
jgi:hypothetical protein